MISGIVSGGKEPLAGVSILIKGIQRGTQTDFDGYYQIEAGPGEELTFSYIGFETQKIIIDSNTINVQLKQSSTDLEGVVVMGYGSVKKKSFTAAAAEVLEEADNTIYNSAGPDIQLENVLQSKSTGIKIRGNSCL